MKQSDAIRRDPTDWDACVVGAGPAGALAASLLVRRRRRVLLLDKATFPRPKVCGGCLGGVGLYALRDAGLSLDTLEVDHHPLRRLDVRSGETHATVGLSRRVAIDREAFDDALLRNAQRTAANSKTGGQLTLRQGVRVTGTTVCRTTAEGERRAVTLTGEDGQREEVHARLVILAAGLGAATIVGSAFQAHPDSGSRFGAGVTAVAPSIDLPVGEVVMACGLHGEGYVGLVRLPDGRIDAAAAVAPGVLRGGARVGEVMASVLSDNGVRGAEMLADAAWRSTPLLTQRPSDIAAERLLVVGDASGYVEPFTGEGIGWALRSAVEAVPIADAAIADWSPLHAERWRRSHARTIGRKQRLCRVVCGLIGGRSVTPAVVRLLRAAPWAAGLFVRSIDGRARPTAA